MASVEGAIVLHVRLFTLDFRPGTLCRITQARPGRERDTNKGEKRAIKRDRRDRAPVKNRIV